LSRYLFINPFPNLHVDINAGSPVAKLLMRETVTHILDEDSPAF
jgi:hypothetical protein